MITHDAIGALSYFARKINFAAGAGEGSSPVEAGESIRIIGARGCSVSVSSDQNLPAVLPQLKTPDSKVVKCINAELSRT